VRKLKKKILSTIFILLALSFISRSDAQADIGYHPDLGENVTVAKDEVLTGPYLQTGNNIVISGTIDGDAYLLGGLVTVDGNINGDLIVGGGAVTIKGEVANDVRAGGGMVNIDGKVGGNVTALGGTVTVGSDADIDGEILTAGGNFACLGNIDGRAQIYADEVTLAGRIGKDIKGTISQLTVTKTAILDGDLNYTSDQEASVSAQAKIDGTVHRTPTGQVLTEVGTGARRRLSRVRWGFSLLSYFSMLLLGFLLLKFVPRQTMAVSKLIGKEPWRVMGLGLLFLVLTPLAVVLLIISVIGVPLAAILVVVYVLMIGLSSLFSGLFIGQKFFAITNLKENRYAMLAVGLLLLQLVFAMPVVGGLVRLLSILTATGAMVTSKRKALSRLEKTNP
jgi:cytoskeletal protein CcmA (bactofilin family)